MARTPPGESREKIYRYMRERLLAGSPPTLREVQQALGFKSVESARSHLDKLAEEGRLVKLEGKSRAFRLPDLGAGGGSRRGRGRDNMVLVPVLGHVEAGQLTEAIQEPEGYVPTRSRVSSGKLFALKVRGESMLDAGIFPDDLVIVRRQPQADSGDIVVAMVDGEATVKTLRKRGRRVILQPENPDFEPIIPDPSEVEILGKVVEVRRYLR